MKIRIEEWFASASKHVYIQVSKGHKWISFGFMNFVEREELAKQLESMAKELRK